VITDIIVLSSLAFALAFVAAWLCSPGLRAWIERPKHRFHQAATEYDLAQHRSRQAREKSSS
jgi:DNA-binding transcriptional MocR family regulator